MFRKLSLKALYDDRKALTLKQQLIYSFVMNVLPALVFIASIWVCSHWVWPDRPLTIRWK